MATMDGQDQDPITGLLAALFGPQGGADDGENTTKGSVTARLNMDPASIHKYPDFFGASRPEAAGEVGPAPAPRPLPDPSASGPNPNLPLTAPGGPIFDNRPPGTAVGLRPAPAGQPGAAGAGAGGDPYQGFLNSAIPNPNFLDKLGRGFSSMQGASGILSALGNFMTTFNGAEPQAALTRAKLGATMKALIKAGASPEEAMAAAMDPKAMEKILPSLMPYERQKLKLEAEKLGADVEKSRFEARKPVEIGVDASGQRVFGVPDPKTGRFVNAMTGEPFTGAMGAPGAAPVTGEGYLATLPQDVAAKIRQVRIGEAQLPKGVSARSGINARVANGIYAYDENYNEQRFPVRLAFTKGGQEAQNIKAVGTFSGHMTEALESIKGLGNTDYNFINAARARLPGQLDTYTAREKFLTDRAALMEEAARVFKGATPGVFEAKTWEERLDPNMPEGVLRSNVNELAKLVHSRLEGLKDQWSATFPEDIPTPSNLQAAEKKLQGAFGKAFGPTPKEGGAGAQGPAILGAPSGSPSAPVGAQGAPGQVPAASGSIPNPFALTAPAGAPEGGPAPMEAPPAPVAPPQAPEPPQGPAIGAPPAQQPGQAPGGPAILGAPPAPAPAAPPQPVATGTGTADAATMPTVKTTAEINALPIGTYFKTVTGDILQRIAESPGFLKITPPPQTSPAPQDVAPPAPAQGGGQPQADAGGYMGGVQAPAPGTIKFAQGPNGVPRPVRFAGGDPADPANWPSVNPEQRGVA